MPKDLLQPVAPLEARVSEVGRRLSTGVQALLDELPSAGPQGLADALGLDKVFASRLLKAARSKDPIAFVHHVPGPDPLVRFARAAKKRGVAKARVDELLDAVGAFRVLIKDEIGDRSALDTLISSWLPEARLEFELRRKQAAYRAMSQLKGAAVDTSLATVILHPTPGTAEVDVLWISGLFGLRRLRPDATIKLTTRRMVDEAADRRPRTLEGDPVDEEGGLGGLRLDRFCDAPPAPLEVRRVGETVQYLLGDPGLGPRAVCDLLLAEVNLREMPRVVAEPRKAFVFAEVSTPCRTLLFDVIVFEDVYPGEDPELLLYDTALEGVANPNDPARDVDRLTLSESLLSLGSDPGTWRVPEVPNYVDLVRHVLAATGWGDERFRAYRCRIDYPLYGSQVVAAFQAPVEGGD